MLGVQHFAAFVMLARTAVAPHNTLFARSTVRSSFGISEAFSKFEPGPLLPVSLVSQREQKNVRIAPLHYFSRIAVFAVIVSTAALPIFPRTAV